jgi:hypothetical protein
MFTPARPLAVNDDQKRELEALVRSGNSSPIKASPINSSHSN